MQRSDSSPAATPNHGCIFIKADAGCDRVLFVPVVRVVRRAPLFLRRSTKSPTCRCPGRRYPSISFFWAASAQKQPLSLSLGITINHLVIDWYLTSWPERKRQMREWRIKFE